MVNEQIRATLASIQDIQKQEENECQIFGKLVAKKLEGMPSPLRSAAQAQILSILNNTVHPGVIINPSGETVSTSAGVMGVLQPWNML